MPKTPFDGFLKSLRDFPEGVDIMLLDKCPHLVIFQIGLEQLIEVMIFDHTSGCCKSEQVVYGGRDFKSALIAVPHDALDPFGIGGAGAHNPADFFRQGPDTRPFGPTVIVVINAGLRSGEMADRRC